MSNFKATQISKALKSGGRPTEYRVTFWDNGGDYASFTAIVGYKKEVREIAKEVKRSLIQSSVLPRLCKTTIEKAY